MKRKVGMSWISLLDLLFGVFGALIVMAALISFKRGEESPISEQPFQLVSVTLTLTHETDLAAVFGQETYLGFHISFGDEAGPAFELSAANGDVPVGFSAMHFTSASDFEATGVGEGRAVLSSTLLIEDGVGAISGEGRVLRIVPVFQNGLRAEEVFDPGGSPTHYSVMMTVIDGASICDLPPVELELTRLFDRREQSLNYGSAVLGPIESADCAGIVIEEGQVVFTG